MAAPARPGEIRTPMTYQEDLAVKLHRLHPALQIPREFHQQLVDLLRTLLLNPVARPGNDNLLAAVRHRSLDNLTGVASDHSQRTIVFADREQRGLAEYRALEKRRELR